MAEVLEIKETVENEVSPQETSKEEKFDFLKSITLVNSANAEKEYAAPKVVPGTVYRKAVSLQYKERKIMYKNDGKGNYERDEEGNMIPTEPSEEKEFELLNIYEELLVAYFKDQFTVEELQEGLDARVYMETLYHAYSSAMGNRTVPEKK